MRCSWPEGTDLLEEVIKTIKDEVRDVETRTKIHENLIALWVDNDCLNVEECLGIDAAFDKAYDNVM